MTTGTMNPNQTRNHKERPFFRNPAREVSSFFWSLRTKEGIGGGNRSLFPVGAMFYIFSNNSVSSNFTFKKNRAYETGS
jgi:hypothetical protein